MPEQETSAAPSIPALSRDRPIALSYAQDRYWLLSLVEPSSTVYHVTAAVRLRGPLQVSTLRAALSALVQRHEALRTVVGVVDGKPVQRILPKVDLPLQEDDFSKHADPEAAVRAAIAALAQIPFDLTQDLLIRARLARLSAADHVLIFSVHRMAADETSLAILWRDLGVLYSNQLSPRSQELPELAIQFADFASWQCDQSHGRGFQPHVSYWQEKLAGELPVLGLATDFPRPPRTAYAGQTVPFFIPEPLLGAIDDFCARTNTDLFSVFTAALATVLGRHSSLDEVILGIPSPNRGKPEAAQVVGRLATMLPVRLGLGSAMDVATFAASTFQTIEQARTHEEVPFERILEALALPRDLARHPLFQVVVEDCASHAPTARFEGLAVEAFPFERATVLFDLHFSLVRTAGRVAGTCAFATSLFKPQRVRVLVEHVLAALEWMTKHPSGQAAEIDLLAAAEKDVLLRARNATARPLAAKLLVHERFEDQVARTPDAIAVICASQRLSYAELNTQANRLAHYLRSQGIREGSRVGICMERSTDMMVALLGAIKAGALYVPIDPQYPHDRQAFMIEDAGVAIVLGQKHLADRIPASQTKLFLLDAENERLAAFSAENLPATSGADALLYMIFTSGSTGKPKGSLVYHRGFVNLLAWYRDEFGFDQSSRFLVFSSLSFDLTQKNLFVPLVSGGTLVLLDTPHYDAARILDLIEEHQITLTNCTPSAFYGLLANTSDHSLRKLCSLTYVVLGGESISLARLAPWRNAPWCKATVVNSYGPTECTDVCAFHRLGDPQNYPASIPIGRPVANTQLYILDRCLRLVPDEAAGELCIGGVGVGAGYVNRPELNAEKFVANPFTQGASDRLYRTGDLVRYLPNGELEFLGRIDHQVKIRGFRIELGEIVTAIEKLPGVQQAYVLPREDAAGDLSLLAYVVPTTKGTVIEATELKRQLAGVLPDYMVPTAFVTLEALPLSPNGKVDRSRLPKPSKVPPTARVTSSASQRSEAEQFVVERWQAILGLPQVGTDERFFDLGGTSIKAIQFIGAMAKELGVALPMVTIFEAPTVGEFVATLRRRYPAALAERFPNERAAEPSKTASTPAADASIRDAGAATNIADTADIAIVGMAVRVPGAKDLDEFWSNLRGGVESVRRLTDEELQKAGVDSELLADPAYVKAAAAMDDIEGFDADFFRMLPREVELMDPQHRAVLECAWSALEHAGYSTTPEDCRVGVFAGVARDAYLTGHLLTHPKLMGMSGDYSMMIGNEKDFPATRVAYRLDLRGPAINVQTACSSSGVGLHLACQSLRADDCDVALVGGCRVITPVTGYLYVDGGTLSPDGHVRAFDAQGRGMVRGSGVAFLAVKRLDRALADGDRVYAVIKATAVNNDGASKVGFTAPSVRGQAAVIRRALALAQVHPDTVGYVETHGTATAIGDPIEVTALTDAYRSGTQRNGYCAIGSVKTNIGHLDAGSCVAGIIKTVLALIHREIPPSMNFQSPNPQIDFANSPFFVNSELREWKAPDGPRRAGVSSFGLGGTNVHVILEEAPPQASGPGKRHQLLVLSARTEAALGKAAENLASHLESCPDASLPDVAFTLQTARTHFDHRRAVVCQSTAEGAAALRKPAGNSSRRLDDKKPEFLFLFPGQGAQHVNMGKALYTSEPVFKSSVDACAEILADSLHLDLRNIIFPPDDQEASATARLNQTGLAQPALFVIGYASARLWMDLDIRPSAMIGHSVGEFAAACLAGVFSLEDALLILAERARLMQSMPPGSMRAVSLSEAALTPHLTGGVSLAGCNAPSLSVVSGPNEAIAAFDEAMKKQGTSCIALHTSHAFHSSMMDPIVPALAEVVGRAARFAPQIPISSTLTGTWLSPDEATDPSYWARQLRQPVRFSQAFERTRAERKYVAIDMGPSGNLAVSARRHLPRTEANTIIQAMPRANEPISADQAFVSALGQAWLAGAAVNWRCLHAGETRLPMSLPTYPFQRKRLWIDPARSAKAGTETTVAPTAEMPARVPGQAVPSGIVQEARGMAQVLSEQIELMERQLELLDPANRGY